MKSVPDPELEGVSDGRDGDAAADAEDEETPEFRVVDSHGPGRDYQPDVGAIIQRLPADGIDVSDQAGIERFVEMCQKMQEQQLQQ